MRHRQKHVPETEAGKWTLQSSFFSSSRAYFMQERMLINALKGLSKNSSSAVVVDEAHCILQWYVKILILLTRINC